MIQCSTSILTNTVFRLENPYGRNERFCSHQIVLYLLVGLWIRFQPHLNVVPSECRLPWVSPPLQTLPAFRLPAVNTTHTPLLHCITTSPYELAQEKKAPRLCGESLIVHHVEPLHNPYHEGMPVC